MIPPLLALALWIPVSILFFRRYPIRVAILLTFIGGWAVLPSANYAPSDVDFAYRIIGASLPSDYFISKASVIGFACLLNVLLFDRASFRCFRLSFWDIPMTVWCMAPLLSAIANPGFFTQGLVSEAYQLLAWGVPYMLGRLYFTETESLHLAARAFILAGLFYVPICLIEIVTGPQFYAHVYGYEPLRWTGAERYFGYRPIGFLENGNQLGIWMATSALIALWLWTRRSVSRILKIPIGWIAALLFLVTLLCQSAGSILLLLGLLPFIFVSRRYLPRLLSIALVLGILGMASLRLTNVVSVRSLAQQNRAAHALASFLKHIGRGSFGWRLAQDERSVNIALQRPVLGSGDWQWWKDGHLRPWGMWLLAFGMYGMIGLLALQALQLVPVIRVAWYPEARSDIEDFNLRYALAAAILMSAIDNLLNSTMILPLVIVIGGMSTWTSAGSRMHIDIEKYPGRALQPYERIELPASRLERRHPVAH